MNDAKIIILMMMKIIMMMLDRLTDEKRGLGKECGMKGRINDNDDDQ
jgi:hypothetical protein